MQKIDILLLERKAGAREATTLLQYLFIPFNINIIVAQTKKKKDKIINDIK